jgi:hypothetical protein
MSEKYTFIPFGKIEIEDKASMIVDFAAYHLSDGETCLIIVMNEDGNGTWANASLTPQVNTEKLLGFLRNLILTLTPEMLDPNAHKASKKDVD